MSSNNPHSDIESARLIRLNLMKLVRRLRDEATVKEIPFSQLSLLGSIDRLGNKVTASELAQYERLKSSNLAMLLRNLSQGGYIIRKTDEKDKRKIRVSVTNKGYELLKNSRDNRDAWLAEQIAKLTKEDANVLNTASKIMHELAHISFNNGVKNENGSGFN